MRSKDEVAIQLAQAHYAIDPGIQRIVRLVAADQVEHYAAEPIKLLEVNANSLSDGIRPLFFGPHAASGVFFPSVIVDVTPSEFAKILQHPSLLPNGWRLGVELPRLTAVGAE